MYTLIVVDMQYKFVAARNKNAQKACKKAIKEAIKNKSPIVFLEFVDYGETLPALTKLTKNYQKAFHVSKKDWDGSKESLTVLTDNKINHTNFKVCGVYTDCCVAATAKGLVDRHPTSKVEVLSSACWATDEHLHSDGLNSMNDYKKRIRLVK
jgi:nicotinamidase-related amidase